MSDSKNIKFDSIHDLLIKVQEAGCVLVEDFKICTSEYMNNNTDYKSTITGIYLVTPSSFYHLSDLNTTFKTFKKYSISLDTSKFTVI